MQRQSLEYEQSVYGLEHDKQQKVQAIRQQQYEYISACSNTSQLIHGSYNGGRAEAKLKTA